MAAGNMEAGEFASKTYDFIIVGGGTAGLVLAARLTEDPNISVGVIEAGEDRTDDVMIQIPSFHTLLYENPDYDWIFKTVPQKHVRNNIHSWPRGRVLGGSSAINFSMVSHPSRQDLDNWVRLGNDGWGFDDLMPYYKKFEKLTTPSEVISAVLGERSNAELHGDRGPIQVSYPKKLTFVQEVWAETCKNLELPSVDMRSGQSITAHPQPLSMDPTTGTRSYAANTYYAESRSRSNLSVITGARVSKIALTRDAGSLTATGVEFTVGGDLKTFVKARREVILCAGAIQSPQLLELSGIGCKAILGPLGIETLVESSGVGENLQDHAMTGCTWRVVEGIPTLDDLRDPAQVHKAVDEFNETATGMFTSNGLTSTAMISYAHAAWDESDDERQRMLEQTAKLMDATPVPPRLQKQYQLQREMLLDPEQASLTMIPFAGGGTLWNSESGNGIFTHPHEGNYMSIVSNIQHPLSRGVVHVCSADINDHPTIDPNYLGNPVDLEVLKRGLHYLAKMIKTEPLASYLNGEIMPGYESWQNGDYEKHVKKTMGTQWHPIGTCSMLPREDGGVVDTSLRVYGVEKLRVIDASIFPLHVQGNIQSLVYAVAEKAADLIKADWK